MVIGQIIGGLGNQMFQYVFYKYLALSKHCELKLDISLFANYALHNGYELKDVFGINEKIATQDEVLRFKSKYSFFFKIENKLFCKNFICGTSHYKENKFHIDEKIYDINIKDFYVEGYFQSFGFVEELGKDLFQFQTKLTESEKKIFEGNVVSIHIRGGDYITNKKDSTLFGNICTKKYYQGAIEYIKQNVKDPIFLIFTNDIEYSKRILNSESFKIVDWNSGKESFRDMYLMSLCKHNIIANSSFSWWGAWLNKNETKIVIAPNRWLNDSNINQTNITPSSWLKMSNDGCSV